MDVHPWLPSASVPGTYVESSVSGSTYVLPVKERYMPTEYLTNTFANPYWGALSCERGSKTVDGTCAYGSGIASAPFWTGSMLGVPLGNPLLDKINSRWGSVNP